MQGGWVGRTHGLATGLRATALGATEEQAVAFADCAEIRFRVDVPADVEIERALVAGPGRSTLIAVRADDGTYVVQGVPPDARYPIRVYARKKGSQTPWMASAVAGPGDLPTLRPRPHPSLWMSIWWGE